MLDNAAPVTAGSLPLIAPIDESPRRRPPRCLHHLISHPTKEEGIGLVEVLDRVTMQVFVREHCTMVAEPPGIRLNRHTSGRLVRAAFGPARALSESRSGHRSPRGPQCEPRGERARGP